MNLPLSICHITRCVLLVVLVLLGTINERAMSQTAEPSYQNSRYTHTISAANLQEGQSLSLAVPPALGITNKVNGAVVNLRLDLGQTHGFGNVAFQAKVIFRLEAIKGNSILPMCVLLESCQLDINRKTPEGLYYQNFATLTNGIKTFAEDVEIIDGFRATIESIVVKVDPVSVSGVSVEANLASNIASSLRLTLDYAIDYGVKVDNVPLAALHVSRQDTTKVFLFGWQPANTHVPNYQFQLLRLYNLDLAEADLLLNDKIKKEEAIITEADWSKALTIETESSLPNLQLTMAEGTGYYAWRVRPLGSYEKGGIANASNYGTWAGDSLPGKLTLQRTALPANVFYYRDIDENRNTIYSRTFTEGNRVSEKITYASSLQQVKQTQTYLPSRQTRILSQTVYDHSNRPALNTLPVPVDDTTGLRGYQPLLVRPQGSVGPYRASNFDEESNFHAPTPVQQNTLGFDYYTGKNNVPSAQGYPFTRSLYYNDGTNRAKEQSGVGRTHMIGDSTGMGRTIKTYYGTASDPELVRLFGSEAPVAASVIKTATVDQNNTTSITYTSKEGKVIATALAFQDQNPLLPLEDAPANVTIKDVIPSQSIGSQGFLGSKRLAFIEATPLDMDYKMDTCNSVTGDCVVTKLKCSYELWVIVSKVDGQPFSTKSGSPNQVKLGSNGKSWAFLSANLAHMQDSTVIYSRDTTVSCTNNASIQFSTLTVPAGTYVIEKKLLPRGQSIVVEAAQDQLDAQSKPLLNLISGWSSAIKCSRDLESFYTKLRQLAVDLQQAKGSCASIPANCLSIYKALDNKYKPLGLSFSDTTFFNASHLVSLVPATGNPLFVNLSAACCQNIQIPLTFSLPIFDFKDIAMRDAVADGEIKVNPFNFLDGSKTEFFPDFEGFAYGYFWDCTPQGQSLIDSVALLGAMPAYTYAGDTSIYRANKNLSAIEKTFLLKEAQAKIKFIYYKMLKPNMRGWETPGTFNLMVQHMLSDVYTCDGKDAQGAIVQERPNDKVDECTGVTSNACPTGTCVQYDGQALFDCWISQLVYLRDKSGRCPNPFIDPKDDNQKPPFKVSNGVDDQNNDGGTKHDSHFNDNSAGSGIMGWFIKRKIKKLASHIRNMQVDPAPEGVDPISVNFNYHMVQQFLNCTGYRFAKILSDAPGNSYVAPLTTDRINTIVYQVPAPVDTNALARQTYSGQYRGYRPNGAWVVPTGSGDSKDTLFKAVKDPVFAFKYFEYVDWTFPEVELTTCYSDPNFYWAPDGVTKIYLCPNSPEKRCNFCGIGRIKCDLTHENWTAGQRNTFYTTISNYHTPSPIDWHDKGMKPGDFASPGYVERDSFYVWSDTHSTVYTENDYTTTVSKLNLNTPQRVKAQVEIDISAMNTGLIQLCNDKRPIYRQVLIDTLLARCYVIGGCKISSDDNVVPLEDLDFLVDAMVKECSRRGVTTTYHTTTDSCRYLFAPRSKPGHVDTAGVRIEYSEVTYGVGSQDDPGCHKALLLYRPAIGSDPTQYATNDTLKAIGSYGNTPFVVRECTGAVLSYQEYIRRKEVTEMSLSISLPSKCLGAPAFVCVPESGSSYPEPTVKDNSLPDTNNPDNPASSGPPRRSDRIELKVEVSKENKVEVSKP
ncbi:MAG: hypothetical protein V4714_02655 [Bacteroidota bacterium]